MPPSSLWRRRPARVVERTDLIGGAVHVFRSQPRKSAASRATMRAVAERWSGGYKNVSEQARPLLFSWLRPFERVDKAPTCCMCPVWLGVVSVGHFDATPRETNTFLVGWGGWGGGFSQFEAHPRVLPKVCTCNCKPAQ